MHRLAPVKTLQLEVEGPVGRLTLNRPEKLNALSPQLLEELIEATEDLNAHAEVKVVVLAGAGRAFCAGFDLDAFASGDGRNPHDMAELGRRSAEALAGIRPVTVAAIHGRCVGGGVVLVSACDLRLAAADTVFSIPEVDLGIPLAWGGIPRLVRELGPALTKELVLTCRPFYAEEARALRFLNRVVPAGEHLAEANALAGQLAEKSGAVLRATKQRVDAVVDDMAGTGGSEIDADLLLAALADPESQELARRYLAAHGRHSPEAA